MPSRTYQEFWQSLPQAHTRGRTPDGWPARLRVLTNEIRMVHGKIEEEECDLLVGLWFVCKQRIGMDTSFNMRQIGEGIAGEPDTYEPLRDLLEDLRWDMAHPKVYPTIGEEDYSRSVAQNMTLNRVTPTDGEPWPGPPTDSENLPLLERTRWLLWLNDNHAGGRLYFPTRNVVVEPKAGTVIRWPAVFPHGIEGVHGTDPAFYMMGESTTQHGQVSESWETRLAPAF